MGFTTKKEGFVKATEMLTSVVNDMAQNGFNIVYLNGKQGTGPASNETTSVCLAATTDVDPLAAEDNQPWRIFIEAKTQQGTEGENLSYEFHHGHESWIRIWICTPTQIIENPDGTWRVAYKEYTNKQERIGESTVETRKAVGAGFLGVDSSIENTLIRRSTSTTTDVKNGYFYCFNQNTESDKNIENIPSWNRTGDFSAHPLSYRLTTTDHGLAFCMWGESYDSSGTDQAWFCTQRMVNKDTGAIIEDSKSPLFTVFSLYGNGDNVDSQDPNQVMYMVTRESDVYTPTLPRSAVTDNADSARIINNKEQVAVGEDEKFIISFPNGLSSQRYGYPHELDLIGYSSADAVSQSNEVELTFYDESQNRKYAGLGSNASFNRGMRILMQIAGIGVDESR